MPYFKFVSDKDLTHSVSIVLDAAKRASAKTELDFEKNVLDPFAALFALTYNNISLEEWNMSEKERQAQKSIQNSIGEFHQSLLGCFKGWENTGRGGSVDLVNASKKIIAEVKNKHNTMNSSSSDNTYKKLADHLKYDKKGYTAYLVQVVPKTATDYNTMWSPNVKTLAMREDIRRIDGESFYDLASGEKDTLNRIFSVMPEIIAKVLGVNVLNDKIITEAQALFARVYK